MQGFFKIQKKTHLFGVRCSLSKQTSKKWQSLIGINPAKNNTHPIQQQKQLNVLKRQNTNWLVFDCFPVARKRFTRTTVRKPEFLFSQNNAFASIQNSVQLSTMQCAAPNIRTPLVGQSFDCRFAVQINLDVWNVKNKKIPQWKGAIWSDALDILCYFSMIHRMNHNLLRCERCKDFPFSFLATLPLPIMHFFKQFPPCSDRPRIELASTIATFNANLGTYFYVTFSFEQIFSESHRG